MFKDSRMSSNTISFQNSIDEQFKESLCLNDAQISVPEPLRVPSPWNDVTEPLCESSSIGRINISQQGVLDTKGKKQDQKAAPLTISLELKDSNQEVRDISAAMKIEGTADDTGIRTLPQPYSTARNLHNEYPVSNDVALEDIGSNLPISHVETLVNKSLDDQRIDDIPESPVTGRIPSPSSASSITSGRRLEWDSGADVGYNFVEDHTARRPSLSTIERIALARGCSAALFERLDPEGICMPPKPVLGKEFSYSTFESPIAKSTPICQTESNRNRKGKELPSVEQPETVLPGGFLFLHCCEEYENDVAPSPKNGSSESEHSSDKCMSDLIKKHSNSLVNLSSCVEEFESLVPRSQSVLDISNKANNEMRCEEELPVVQTIQKLVTGCSVSSSSVATIIQKPIFPATLDKVVQTLPLAYSVGVQTSENTDNSHSFPQFNEEPHKIASVCVVSDKLKQSKEVATPSVIKTHTSKCGGAHKKGVHSNSDCCRVFSKSGGSVLLSDNTNKINKNDQREERENNTIQMRLEDEERNVTVNSATSSTQSVESSCVLDTYCSGTGIMTDGVHGSTGAGDSANSFEYLPGNKFKNGIKQHCNSSKPSVMSETSEGNISALNKENSVSHSGSLSEDIEEGVKMLQKLMSEKLYNSKNKKSLIRQIVNKLVNTKYAEDSSNKDQFQGLSLSSNVPWVPASCGVHSEAEKSKDISDSRTEQSKLVASSLPSRRRANENLSPNAASEECSSPSNCTPSGSLSVPADNEQSVGGSSKVSSSPYSTSNDWKAPTSAAEKVFEEKRKSSLTSTSTNSLLHFCKSEHDKQLQWIRFEIDHLSHLKQLLEKQKQAPKSISVDNDHKFHKRFPANTKSFCCELQRSKKESDHLKSCLFCKQRNNHESGCDNPSVTMDSCARSINTKAVSHQSQNTDRDLLSERHVQSKLMGRHERNHNLSTQTTTYDSFIIGDPESNITVKGSKTSSSLLSDYDRGKLNVYVHSSPKVRKKPEAHHDNAFYDHVPEGAKKRYEKRVKCCCENRKTLKEIIPQESTRKDVHRHLFCKCKSRFSDNASGAEYSSYELSENSGGLPAQKSVLRNYTRNTVSHSGKQNVGTETVVNKGVQTFSSVRGLPINQPTVRQGNRGRAEALEDENVFCPCCGLLERSSHDNQSVRLNVEENSSLSSLDKNHLHHKVNDVAIQTSIKEPLAYLITFEPTCEQNIRSQRNDSLPEIKLLVPRSQPELRSERKCNTDVAVSKENQAPLQFSKETTVSVDPPIPKNEGRKQKLTLQEYLKSNRPDYIQNADKRSQCLADLALLRDLRKQKRLELLSMTEKLENLEPKGNKADERNIFSSSAIPTKPKFSTRTMREQSRKKYQKSKEIQKKLAEKKRKEDFRTNRLMAELFTKKLQKKVLDGVVNYSNSTSVISSVL